MDDLLFYNRNRADLSDVLRAQTEKMKADIADTPPTRMNGAIGWTIRRVSTKSDG